MLKKNPSDGNDIDQEILIWQTKLEAQQEEQKQIINQIQYQEVSVIEYQSYLFEKSNLEREINSKKKINEQLHQSLYDTKKKVSQRKVEVSIK